MMNDQCFYRRLLTVFLHMPKTGGTTIRTHVERHYQPGEIVNLYAEFTYGISTVDYLYHLSAEEKERARAVFGHHFLVKEAPYVFEDREIHKIMFLRDPFERIISVYNHHRRAYEETGKLDDRTHLFSGEGEVRSFPDWFERVKDAMRFHYVKYVLHFCENDRVQSMCRLHQGHLERAKRILDGFTFIGITEQPEDFLYSYLLMDVPVSHADRMNATRCSFIDLSERELQQMKAYVHASHPYERELYEYAREINRKQKEQLATKLGKSLTFASSAK